MSTHEVVARPDVDPGVYPYFVLRHMPTVYSRGKPNVAPKHRRPDGTLTEEGREAFINVVARLSERQRKSVCAIFGPDDAVYCEPDGSRKPNRLGEGVPDGYTHIQLRAPVAEQEPQPAWRDFFARWDRPFNIWAVRGDADRVFRRLDDLGVPRAWSIGGSPGGQGGTDVSAWPFLDGGIQWATRDGFVSGVVSGAKVTGERALVWCCHVLEVEPPRTCARFAGTRLDAQIEEQVAGGLLPASGDVLAEARTWRRLREVAADLAQSFDEWEAGQLA